MSFNQGVSKRTIGRVQGVRLRRPYKLTRIVKVRRQRPRGPQRIRAPVEKQKSSELSFAAPWLVPSPRYFANFKPLLVERSQDLASCYGGNRGARRLSANHSVFERAEAADTGLVHRDWNGLRLRTIRSEYRLRRWQPRSCNRSWCQRTTRCRSGRPCRRRNASSRWELRPERAGSERSQPSDKYSGR